MITLHGIEAIGHKCEGFEVVALWPLGKLRDFADALMADTLVKEI
jgi:hypothetical protein